MIQLDDIPNLASLVSSFDQQQLATFCRILAVTISEVDLGSDDKHTLLAKNAQQKKNLGPSRAEINQGNCYNESKCGRISAARRVSLFSMSDLQQVFLEDTVSILSLIKRFFVFTSLQQFPGNSFFC